MAGLGRILSEHPQNNYKVVESEESMIVCEQHCQIDTLNISDKSFRQETLKRKLAESAGEFASMLNDQLQSCGKQQQDTLNENQ